MVLTILISSFTIDVIFSKKINYKLLLIAFFSLCPFIIWKYIVIKNNADFTLFEYETGHPITRFLDRITNTQDLLNIFYYVVINEKLVLSLIIFIFCVFKSFSKNRRLIFFIIINFLLYFFILIFAYLIDPFDLLLKLNTSSTRVFVPLVLMLTYFSLLLIKNEYPFKENASSNWLNVIVFIIFI